MPLNTYLHDVKKTFVLAVCIGTSLASVAQAPWNPRPKGEGVAGFTSYSDKWKIVQESGKIHGTVVKFNRALRGCGDVVSSSVAILKRQSDTIRVIMLCYNKTLSPGQSVTIEVEKWESGFGPGLPTDDEYYGEHRMKGQHLYRVNEYDEIVAKTVFGKPVGN